MQCMLCIVLVGKAVNAGPGFYLLEKRAKCVSKTLQWYERLLWQQHEVAGRRREDDMAEWDQEKLESVVAQKHGAEKGNSNRATEIICKFFLDAVEAKQYGWCAPVP